jgi:hypothetical protein
MEKREAPSDFMNELHERLLQEKVARLSRTTVTNTTWFIPPQGGWWLLWPVLRFGRRDICQQSGAFPDSGLLVLTGYRRSWLPKDT